MQWNIPFPVKLDLKRKNMEIPMDPAGVSHPVWNYWSQLMQTPINTGAADMNLFTRLATNPLCCPASNFKTRNNKKYLCVLIVFFLKMTCQISLVSTLSSCFDKLIKFDIYGFKFVLPRHLVLVKCLLAGWRAQWRAKLCSFGLFLFTGSALWDLEQKIRCQTFLWTNNQWFQQQQNMTNHNYSVFVGRGYSHFATEFFNLIPICNNYNLNFDIPEILTHCKNT